MNETMKNILGRRSTRSFLPGQISQEHLNQILEAGLSAPSANNQQSWHFSVIQKKELIDGINEKAKKAARESQDSFLQKIGNDEQFHGFYHAPTVIVVSGDTKSMMPETDCAAAAQNMLIAAESLGLGSCWVGVVALAFQGPDADVMAKDLGVPVDHKPYYAIALGPKKNSTGNPPIRKQNTVIFV